MTPGQMTQNCLLIAPTMSKHPFYYHPIHPLILYGGLRNLSLPFEFTYGRSHEANWGSNEYKDDVVGVGGVCFVEHEKGDGARVDYTKCKLEYSFQYHDDDEYYNDGNYLDKGRSRTYSDDVDDENGNKTPSKSYKDYNNNEFHDVAEEEEEEDEEKKKNLSVSADRSGEDNGIEDDSFNPRKYDKTREKEVGMKSNGRMQESGVIHSSLCWQLHVILIIRFFLNIIKFFF